MKNSNLNLLFVLLMGTCLMSACSNSNDEMTASTEVVLANHSTTPVLAKKLPGFENLEMFSLLGSDDKLAQSPNFVFGGSADGAGLLKSGENYVLLCNHEDNFAVSRITLDKTFKPVRGEYVLNSTGGLWRLCSATLTSREVHGFGPLYLTCGESGEESRTHGLNPMDDASRNTQSRELAGLGRWNAENAVPLPAAAYPNRTAILIGDDDSGTFGGQIALYLANTVGDLQSGALYVLKRTDNNVREMDIRLGQRYPVEFVRIDNHTTLTGRQINEASARLNSIAFGRVEDIDYRKGSAANSREIYINATGQNNTGVNASYSRSKYGRVYRLVLDANDPLRGNLEVVLDGDDRTGIAREFQNVDNICVTENFVYTQEDPNGYGDETHDAYIYQYNIATREFKKVIELDHRRTATDAAKYNVGGASRFGSWEYGAMEDISDLIGVPNTFMICVQPHTWVGEAYRNADGGTLRPNEQQASQIIILKGLQK
jgi:hypothetical protein